MKTKYLLPLLSLLVAFTLLLGACAPTVAATDSKDPVTVVQNFYEILNTKDVAKAMSLTAEDYVMNDPFGTYNRAGAVVAWQSVVDAGLSFNQTNFVDTGNGRVTSCYEVLENGKSIDKGCGNVTHVRDGKIIFDGLESAEQIWIVQKFYQILNTKDVEKAMSLTAEDYVMNDPFGTYNRTEAATQWNAVVNDYGLSFNQTDFVNTGNGRVTSCYEVFENGTSIDKGCGNVTHVRDGKIIYDGLESAEQIWVVQKYYEALNAKKLDLAMSFIAPDALFINPTGTYEGVDAIRKSLEGLNTDGITFDLSNFRNTDGTIIYDYEVLQGGNVLDKGTNGLTAVKDGMIVFDGTEETVPAAFRPSDPASIAQYFYKAINTGDLEAAMALVADDIQCRGDCYINGISSFRSFIQASINTGLTEISDLQVEGDTVTYNWTGLSKAGFVQARGVETLQIKDGKIILMESVGP
jgi:ketosteroid isomerase-like protein